MNLYNKYRPKKFADIIGGLQHQAIRILQHKISSGVLPPAILLSGPSGVAKTTIARIYAATILCSTPNKGTYIEPCGTCTSCISIWNETGYELIDGSVDTGIDAMREFLSKLSFRPLSGKSKIVLFDEMHNLSKQAQESLLTTVENPPSHLVLMFCTTDPRKVLKTLKTRCLQLSLESPKRQNTGELLLKIAKLEHTTLSDDEIIKNIKSWESVREAINELEILLSGGRIVEDNTSEDSPEKQLAKIIPDGELPKTRKALDHLQQLLTSVRSLQTARAFILEYTHSKLLSSMSDPTNKSKVKRYIEIIKLLSKRDDTSLPCTLTVDILEAIRIQ